MTVTSGKSPVTSATGGCACGAVRYRVEGPLRDIVACHCESCRRQSGHYVAATSCLREHITITGDVSWWAANEGHKRGFCAICGSLLFWDADGNAGLSIFAGSLDTPTGLKLIGHIYASEKADYYEITDNLPVTEARNPDVTTRIDP